MANLRRRMHWRLTLLLLHLLLFFYSLIIGMLIFIPSRVRRPSSLYSHVKVLILIIIMFSALGLIVYSRCRFLIRILGIVSAVLIGVVSLFFVVMFVSEIACRSDEKRSSTFEVTVQNCTGGSISKDENSTLECRVSSNEILQL